jgi:hypothetical protein
MERAPHHYQLLIYQVPSQPSAGRVGVWRELKRLGALYLQQSVCILPSVAPMRVHVERITARITALGGDYHLLPIRALPPPEEAKIIEGFLAQSNAQYEEIIENCAVNFTKEIEFETYRQNFTYAEAEEIRHDLDKIHRWFDRVVERDWYGAEKRAEALRCIETCEVLLEGFEERVFAAQTLHETVGLGDDESGEASANGTVSRIRPLGPRRAQRRVADSAKQ